MNVYFISGLGADRRAFEKLRLSSRYTIHYLDWIVHQRGESLNAYARRLAAFVDTSRPFAVVGLSMGGMVASAMTQFLQPQKTILLSSVGAAGEFPPLLKLARFTQVHRLVPTFLFNKPNAVSYFLFGARSRNEKRIMQFLIGNSDPGFVKWSIGAILGWEIKVRPNGIYHIHGDQDKILPIRYTRPDVVIKNGSHFMVWTKAREISAALERVLGGEEQTNSGTRNR